MKDTKTMPTTGGTTAMKIIFRKWIDGTLSVCNGTNHYRQDANGNKKWFEGCPYSNPELSHRRIAEIAERVSQ